MNLYASYRISANAQRPSLHTKSIVIVADKSLIEGTEGTLCSLRITTEDHEYPYTLSIASSASSSAASVFSLDAPSSQSSVSSTSVSWENENDNALLILQADSRLTASAITAHNSTATLREAKLGPTPIESIVPVAPESRQHPRRTQPHVVCNGSSTAAGPRPPPSLVRQSERKDNFVEGLVDTTTQMIETIWPLSVLSCGRDTSTEGKNQNLIGLKTFVQEVLRRSKTSYSTLQVALYYLVLVQSCLPRHDFTMEQREDSQACRAMQCGRRMFLASLILASKYLQDRNFSARAWSKISGLKATEINANELAFVKAVGWKLHIPEPVFQRWTDIVLKYSPSASSLSSPRSSPGAANTWKAIIPLLTPDLAQIEFGHAELANDRIHTKSELHPSARIFKEPIWSTSNEATPTATTAIPKTLEPTPRPTPKNDNILPALPRLGPLPTPTLTPQTHIPANTFSTPAVGAEGLCPRRSSMSIAMEQARNMNLARMTLDNPYPAWRPMLPQPFPTSARRSSLARTNSSVNSPESMISDVSSRSSRSSSISSIASSTCALPLSRPCSLAVQATRRCAEIQMSGIKEDRSASQALSTQEPSPEDERFWETLTPCKAFSASPTASASCAFETFSKPETHYLHCIPSAHEAASALQDLALGQLPQPVPRPAKSRKRERPLSIDLSTQGAVRDVIAPRTLADISNGGRCNGDDSIVLPDGKLADSFLVSRYCAAPQLDCKLKPMLAKDGPRKRTCGNAAPKPSTVLGKMPSAVTPNRRSRETSFDDEDVDSSHVASSAAKRARLNLNGDTARSSQSPNLPNGRISNGNGILQEETLHPRRSKSKHQPGSIVRVKLANFVTYTAVEFLPGPSLNMVIGPNGTGKSTLVCAICLGLGWGPQHLGRAKDVSEYVKHGEQEANIEIELAADPKRHRRNPVIKCNIKRENNKSSFSIDGKPSNKKAVIELCKSFTIQIDNLCQFLPQDKVVEFAAMTPVELLRSTQRAVAPQEMLDMHDELKDHRQKQKSIQAKVEGDQDALQNLENRQRMQADDVQRMRDREVIKERVRLLEASRPFADYREAKAKHAEAKERRIAAVADLKKLEEDVEPSLTAVNAKQAYTQQVQLASRERKKGVQDAEANADKIDRKLKTLHDRKAELEGDVEAEKTAGKESRKEIARLDQNIVRLKKQIEEPPPDTDTTGFNERIRERGRAIDEAHRKVAELKRKQEDLTYRGREKSQRILQAQRDLENLESQAGQQETKLKAASFDTHRAWEWIKQHQDEFEKHVFGPPIVECSVTDLNYVDQMETLLQRTQMLTITCQTKNDFKKLSNILHDRLHLAEVNIQQMDGTLENFPSPIAREELRQYGLTGWALDYMSGPEPVMAMLCANVRLQATGMGDRDTTPEQFELLQNSSPIENWVTKKSAYKITRRREYGPGATSTSVRDVRKAQIWTNQPVDIRAKRDLQENIDGWSGEIVSIKQETQDAQDEIVKLRESVREHQAEEKSLTTEKTRRQKIQADINGLPQKLRQEEVKLASAKQSIAEMRQHLQAINEKQDQLTRERAEAALAYVAAVEILQQRHAELYEVEIMLIEANSDLAFLTERNASVKELLETKRQEVEKLAAETKVLYLGAQKAMNALKEIMDNADDALREHIRQLDASQSREQLEDEISSERARLELMHEGNDRGVIKEFEAREKRIVQLRERLEEMRDQLGEAEERISGVREQWEPELDRLVGLISKSFGENMKEIGCAGEVGVAKEDDFENWAIRILVKFR
ncbi:MAG: hypothetical protein Q9218_005299, partial [Villophora microphyllina]